MIWQHGPIVTTAGAIPRVTSRLGWHDRLGGWRVRWGIGRYHYRVAPGLYALASPGGGAPDARSPVLVTANFKMSFDRLRSSLADRAAWILVLDTRGINVWCAAGKGTFGTDELVRQIQDSGLEQIVGHHRLIVPQLGAPGVSAPAVRERTGWRVIYGPVQASDLPAFLDAGYKATAAMRRVTFPFSARLALVPMELVGAARYVLVVAVLFWLLSGFGQAPGEGPRQGVYSLARAVEYGPWQLARLLMAYLAGAALAPALLPWLPGRAFSFKGISVGAAVWAISEVVARGASAAAPADWIDSVAWLLLTAAIASFLAMNFTGASTFTSLSGVRHEMRRALPAQIAAAASGLFLWLAGRLL